MTITLEELERRLIALEQEVASLRQRQEPPPVSAGPRDGGSQIIRDARAMQPLITAMAEKIFSEMGITAKAVPPERLRQMMSECGVKPEANAASREIIAMREE